MNVRSKGLLVVFAALFAFAGCSDDPPPTKPNVDDQNGSIYWEQMTFEQAQAYASAEEKFLVVYAMASWCPWCARMSQETWVDESVVAWVRDRAVALRWETDADPGAMPISLRVLPTVIVYAGQTEVARQEGFLAPAEFVPWLESITATGKPVTE